MATSPEFARPTIQLGVASSNSRRATQRSRIAPRAPSAIPSSTSMTTGSVHCRSSTMTMHGVRCAIVSSSRRTAQASSAPIRSAATLGIAQPLGLAQGFRARPEVRALLGVP